MLVTSKLLSGPLDVIVVYELTFTSEEKFWVAVQVFVADVTAPLPPDELMVWFGHEPVIVMLVPCTNPGDAVPVPPFVSPRTPVTWDPDSVIAAETRFSEASVCTGRLADKLVICAVATLMPKASVMPPAPVTVRLEVTVTAWESVAMFG